MDDKPAAAMLFATATMAPAAGNFDWVSISNGDNPQPLQSYLIPQLTRGTGINDKDQPTEDSPLYVAMLYLSHPEATQANDATPVGDTAANDADSFADLVNGLTL